MPKYQCGYGVHVGVQTMCPAGPLIPLLVVMGPQFKAHAPPTNPPGPHAGPPAFSHRLILGYGGLAVWITLVITTIVCSSGMALGECTRCSSEVNVNVCECCVH